MATPQDNSNQQEANRLLSEYYDISLGLNEILRENIRNQGQRTAAERQQLKSSNDLLRSLQNQRQDLSKLKDLDREILKNKKLLSKAQLDLNSLTSNLLPDQKKLVQSYAQSAVELGDLAAKQASLVEQGLHIAANAAEYQKLNQEIFDLEQARQTNFEGLAEGEERKAAALAAQIALVDSQNAKLKEQRELVKKALAAYGPLAGIAEALKDLPIIGSGFAQGLNAANQEIEDLIAEGKQLGKDFQASDILVKNLADSIQKVAFAFLLKQLLDLNKALVETNRTLGLSKMQMLGLEYELRAASTLAGEFGVVLKDQLQTIQDINKQTGLLGTILTTKNITAVSALREQLGLSAEAATQLGLISGINGTTAQTVAENVYDTVNAFNQVNKTALSARTTLEQVATTSKTIGAYFMFNTNELTKAVVEAQKLGLTLEEVNGIASNLLQFESSISAELEAELFLGKNINLERARQFALTNDLAGLSKELSQNESVRAAFASNNRFAIEKTAAALGMSVDQMSKLFYQQELVRMGAESFRAAYGDQNLEAAKQLDIQQRMERAFMSLGEAILPLVEALATISPLIEGIGMIMGVIALSYIPTMATGFLRMISPLATLVGLNTANAAASLSTLGATTLGVGLALVAPMIAGAISSMTSAVSQAKEVNDAYFPSDGSNVLTGPAGTFKFNKNDNIVASTNDIPVTGQGQNSNTTAVSMEETNKLLKNLIAVQNTPKQLVSTNGEAFGRVAQMDYVRTGG